MAGRTRDLDVRDTSIRIINWRNLRKMDWFLPLIVLALATVGWFTLYSASRTSDHGYFTRQIVVFLLSVPIVLLLVATDYRFLVAWGPVFYLGGLALLLAVEFFGYEAKGSERWLVIGPVRLQPSEMNKVILVYALTWYLTTVGRRIRKLHWFLLTFVLVGIPMGLILKQPNLGTAACLAPLVIVMLFVAGCRLWHLGVVIALALSVIPVLWFQMKDFNPEIVPEAEQTSVYELKHYQKKRIYTFLHPEYDPQGSGWHTTQSMITVGSGGLSGKGYLQGTQTRLNYLPEHHTDFIFSLLAEEQGFIGSAIVIALFAAFLMRGLMYARDCPDMMGTLLATGVITVLGFHIFVNIAITIGLMPVTGIPLPFLSYGRSFYITTMVCVGVLLSVPIRRNVFVNIADPL